MDNPEFDHEFNAADECDVCGEYEDYEQHDSSHPDFHHEYEQAEVCHICGMDEDDEAHQEEI